MITQYDFFRTKYGDELLIDLIRLEDLEKYIRLSPIQRLTYYDITIIADGNGTFNIDGHVINLYSYEGDRVYKWNCTEVYRLESNGQCKNCSDTLVLHQTAISLTADTPKEIYKS